MHASGQVQLCRGSAILFTAQGTCPSALQSLRASVTTMHFIQQKWLSNILGMQGQHDGAAAEPMLVDPPLLAPIRTAPASYTRPASRAMPMSAGSAQPQQALLAAIDSSAAAQVEQAEAAQLMQALILECLQGAPAATGSSLDELQTHTCACLTALPNVPGDASSQLGTEAFPSATGQCAKASFGLGVPQQQPPPCAHVAGLSAALQVQQLLPLLAHKPMVYAASGGPAESSTIKAGATGSDRAQPFGASSAGAAAPAAQAGADGEVGALQLFYASNEAARDDFSVMYSVEDLVAMM